MSAAPLGDLVGLLSEPDIGLRQPRHHLLAVHSQRWHHTNRPDGQLPQDNRGPSHIAEKFPLHRLQMLEQLRGRRQLGLDLGLLLENVPLRPRNGQLVLTITPPGGERLDQPIARLNHRRQSFNRCNEPLLVLLESLSFSRHAATGCMELTNVRQHGVARPALGGPAACSRSWYFRRRPRETTDHRAAARSAPGGTCRDCFSRQRHGNWKRSGCRLGLPRRPAAAVPGRDDGGGQAALLEQQNQIVSDVDLPPAVLDAGAGRIVVVVVVPAFTHC